MGDRRQQHSVYNIIRSGFCAEEREPEDYYRLPRRRTVIVEESRVRRRYNEHRDRSVLYPLVERRRRASTPSPPPLPRAPSPPPRRTTFIMSPKDSPTTKPTKPFIPLPKPLPVKKDEDKAKKDKPKVKILETGHKKSTSLDTGYASGFSSPWSVEDRSPFDYSPSPKLKSQSQSPKPRIDREVYEVVDTPTVVRKYSTKRGDVQYVSRRPKISTNEDSVHYLESKDVYKDRYKEARATAKVLQQALVDEAEKAQFNHDAAKQQEAQRLMDIETLEFEVRKLKLEKRLSDSKAAEAEKKYKLSEIERLEEKERELKRREKEFELEKRQWKEIEATPSPFSTRRPTLPPLIQQSKPERRNTSQSPYSANVLTDQPLTTLVSGNAGLEAIFEAQRDADRKKAHEAREARDAREAHEQDAYYTTRPSVKETGRPAKDYRRPRRDDRYI